MYSDRSNNRSFPWEWVATEMGAKGLLECWKTFAYLSKLCICQLPSYVQ